jgi:hypothetical protein
MIKTHSQVPLIVRLAREEKQEEYDVAIFIFRRCTLTYEDLKRNFNNKKFLRYFEYI